MVNLDILLEIDTSDALGILEYYFILIDGYDRLYYGNNDEHLGGIGQIYVYNPVPYQITVYEKSYIPNWYKEGVIYQILIDRFYNGNEDNTINYPKRIHLYMEDGMIVLCILKIAWKNC